MTLYRIETGAASVTVGALMNVLEALDLSLGQLEGAADAGAGAAIATRAETIELAAYPLLEQLAWHVQGTGTLSPAEAAGLHTHQRRRLDLEELQPQERQLIASLTHVIPEPDVRSCCCVTTACLAVARPWPCATGSSANQWISICSSPTGRATGDCGS